MTYIPGIYAITCTANGRLYIGSSLNWPKRTSSHLKQAETKTHWVPSFIEDYHTYGKEAFTVELVEAGPANRTALRLREVQLISELQPFYNTEYTNKPTKRGLHMRGRTLPQATREKLRQAMLNRQESLMAALKGKM